MPYPPRLSLDDTQIITRDITTPENTNLMKNEATVVEAIRKKNAAIAAKA